MIWQVPRIWEGGDVWIIGGGPSVAEQFNIPKDIVQKVVDGGSPALYSSYMKPIHDKHVIGVNVAYMLGNWVDMVFFGDSGFFLSHQKGLVEHQGMKVSCHPKTDRVPWVRYLPRDRKQATGISRNPKTVSWNKNSGAAAISLAAHAGAKRIILLGFDMKLGEDKGQHWHDVYGKRKSNGLNRKGRKVGLPFERHLRGFPKIAEDAKRLGIEVINVNPTSAINCFEKISLKEVL